MKHDPVQVVTVKAAFTFNSPFVSSRLLPALLIATGTAAATLLLTIGWTSEQRRAPAPPAPALTAEAAIEPAPPPVAPSETTTPSAPAKGLFLGLVSSSLHLFAERPAAEPEPAPAPDVASAPLPPKRPQLADAPAAARPAPGPVATAPAAPAEARGIFERLFNVQPAAPSQALAYARPEDPAASSLAGKPMPMGYDDGRTAVYDISAKMVFMPNGEKLEAHSGLGPLLDDPGQVHVKNRGATPPNVYNLSLRESLFHGVQALRMTPVGGSTMFGRDGILAHTYMLGPNGDSNGCVSFKDYARFLQAFHAGDVKRLIVVARRG